MTGHKPDDTPSQWKSSGSARVQHLMVSLLSGQDFWRTRAIPSHQIPALKVTDGPNGARGEYFTDGTPAALFPCGVSLAATWNPELLHRIGQALAAETKARSAQVLLAPTVCLHRSPLGGRNFESFSEDPLLTGKLAAACINGLQSEGVGATVKHFVGNEQETWRMSVDSVIEERPLRELYLKPFEIVVRDAKPWGVMSSYNKVNGVHADMNEFTLQKILRGEWGFDGVVMSDWGGTNSTLESIKAGCDLEMPGPTKIRGEQVLEAINDEKLTVEDIDNCVFRILTWIERCGRFDLPLEELPETSIDTPSTRSLTLEAATEGIVLLKNVSSILPLGPEVRKIALIGPNVQRAISHGGGSASLNPYYQTTPYESLQSSGKEILYAPGAETNKWLPLASSCCRTPAGDPGVILEFYKGDQFLGPPAVIQHRLKTDLFLWDNAPASVLPAYSFKIKATITPKTSGTHTFGLSSVGPARLLINGEVLIDNWNWTIPGEAMFDASIEALATHPMTAGETYEILIESTNAVRPAPKLSPGQPTHGYGGCRFGFQEEQTKDLISEAAAVAAEADVAIVIVGLDAEWESEGYDRQSMDLPKDGNQDKLIEAVAKANPNTVVVVQAGSPVSMPWVEEVMAVVMAWYQGQEAGNALVDILLGKANPSGKLPMTWPKRLKDTPAYNNWPGEDKRVVYGEGLFIGYRHYDRVEVEPQFDFGYGMSYTDFIYSEPKISGTMRGKETVQLYIRDPKSRLLRPEKELKAFVKVDLEPGEAKLVEFSVDKFSVGYYDPSLGSWIAEEGEFEACVALSAGDIRGSVTFEVTQSFTWVF
ncbi:Similar to Beta-glucosidase B; acc. no. Q5BFG8 [Pyronema omphalodes CBS 100304]|uniref:beta-glucosidase n=1 Tax=Pyronema omphalodes (strain CBS 100304) TaxID=1076935 RepID=U4LFR5_PYROM|nr:Similar to Beta-glucosidase B; acc. no. Q5BFG8 [Pyronema omphalodes CBS 100304]